MLNLVRYEIQVDDRKGRDTVRAFESDLTKQSGATGRAATALAAYEQQIDKTKSALGKGADALGAYDRATKSVDETSKAAWTRISHDLERFGQGARTVGFGLTAAITVPILAVAGAAVKLGMDAVESENLVTVSFGDMKQAADEWSKSLSRNLGLNEFELRKTAGTLFNMTTSMGLSRDAAFDMSTGVAELAADMASFRNIGMDEALTKIRAGLVGETEPLKAIGILVDEATVKTYAYTTGIAKQGEELTQTQKVAARWQAILAQTKNDQGDLARTLDSPTNQLRIMRTRIEEAATSLGMALMPMVSAITTRLSELVPYVQSAVRWFTALPAPVQMGVVALAGIAAAAGPALLFFGSVASAITMLIPLFQVELVKAAASAATGAVNSLRAIATQAATSQLAVGALSAALAGLAVGGLVVVAAKLDEMAKNRAAEMLAEQMNKSKEPIKQVGGALVYTAESAEAALAKLGPLGQELKFGTAHVTTASVGLSGLGQRLADARKEIDKLTPAVKRDLTEAFKSGAFSLKELQEQTGLSEQALKLFQGEIKDTTKDVTESDQELKKWTTSIENATIKNNLSVFALNRFGAALPNVTSSMKDKIDATREATEWESRFAGEIEGAWGELTVVEGALEAGIALTGALTQALQGHSEETDNSRKKTDDAADANKRYRSSLIDIGQVFSQLGHEDIGALISAIGAADDATRAFVTATQTAAGASVATTAQMVTSWVGVGMAIYSAMAAAQDAALNEETIRRHARRWGVFVSDSLREAINDTIRDMQRRWQEAGENITVQWIHHAAEIEAAASRINMARILSEDGGLRTDNVRRYTRELLLLFDDVRKGWTTTAQAASVLDDVFDDFVEANTDAWGFLQQEIRDVIVLDRALGIESKAVTDYLQDQAQRAADGFNAIASALGGTSTSVQSLGLLALATFDAMITSGSTYSQALRAIAPGLQDLQESFKRLGLETDNAGLKILLLQASILEKNPELFDAVEGLAGAFAALSNMGLLNIETFDAMTALGIEGFERLKSAAMERGATESEAHRLALLAMQGYLHAAEQAAQELGIPLDENTQRLIDQSKELGLWKDQGKSGTDALIAGLDKVVDRFDTLLRHLGAIPASLPDPFAGWTTPPSMPTYPDQTSDTDGERPPPGVARGGYVTTLGIEYFGNGGRVLPFRARGIDTVPAMLAVGEGVVNRGGMRRLGRDGLEALNRGEGVGGPSVTNHVTVYVDGDVNSPAARQKLATTVREVLDDDYHMTRKVSAA